MAGNATSAAWSGRWQDWTENALTGDRPALVADAEPVNGCPDGEPSVLVGGTLVDRCGPESKASALSPASTIARSSAGRLITVAQTKRLGSKALVGVSSRSVPAQGCWLGVGVLVSGLLQGLIFIQSV